MNVLTAAFYQRLVNDSVLADLLTEYPAGLGVPAVFTDDRVPQDAQLPYIVTSGETANEPSDTKNSEGRRPFRDVYCYAPHQSTKLVEDIAERVRELFHRHKLPVAGYTTVIANAHGPVRLSADDYDARLVSVRLRLEREEEESS